MDEASMPSATIVISTANRSESIAKTVQATLRNDYPNFELIVVDQSEDNQTMALPQQLSGNPRLRYIRTAMKGVSAGRNIGISNARSEFIAITDDDCEMPPNWLREMVAAFAVDSRVGIVFGNVLPRPHNRASGFIPAYVRQEPFLACSITPRVALIHNGFRTWDQGRTLIHRYWYGAGAVMAKHLKFGQGSIVQLLLRLAWRWAFRRSLVATSLGTRPYRLLRLAAFIQGFASGAVTPIDRSTGHYAYWKRELE